MGRYVAGGGVGRYVGGRGGTVGWGWGGGGGGGVRYVWGGGVRYKGGVVFLGVGS